ncbi:hypothetical protein SLOPH_775 [Spraguea lophii 42_110]|uniref:Uncharacterized protein n=1 Tax=Spraguea lophii (strain 42_110) TaxID=1358809 RepID=S7W4L2_SPRLO|nr:hypothetical protein SLOPH_775 [Spraguea lophii 42_110]
MPEKKLSTEEQLVFLNQLMKKGTDYNRIRAKKMFKNYDNNTLQQTYREFIKELGEDDLNSMIMITNIKKIKRRYFIDAIFEENNVEKEVKNIYFNANSTKCQKLLTDYLFRLKKKCQIAEAAFKHANIENKIKSKIKESDGSVEKYDKVTKSEDSEETDSTISEQDISPVSPKKVNVKVNIKKDTEISVETKKTEENKPTKEEIPKIENTIKSEEKKKLKQDNDTKKNKEALDNAKKILKRFRRSSNK